MKIIERILTVDELENRDYRDAFEIEVSFDSRTNNTVKLSFCDGEPEDNSLGRGFNDCYKIVEAIKSAYLAGYAREDLKTVEEYLKD